MKKIILTTLLMIFCCMLIACGKQKTADGRTIIVQKYTTKDPDATELIAYFGERAKAELEEIPTFKEYLTSQEKAHISDFIGTDQFGGNHDPRRLFFNIEIEEINLEYEDDGRIREMELTVEKIDDGLYRVNPYRRIYYFNKTEKKELSYSDYFTFKIKTADGKVYYMTWVPAGSTE